MCKRMRMEMAEDDLELLEGLVLALREKGMLKDGNQVTGILEALDEATPVPELPRVQGTVAF